MGPYNPEELGERPKDFGLGAGPISDERKLRNEIQFIKYGIVDLRDDFVRLEQKITDLSGKITSQSEERAKITFWLKVILIGLVVILIWSLFKR